MTNVPKENLIGKVLRNLRQEGRYTQKQFADLLGISRSFLSELETGEKNPSVQLLHKISETFKIPPAILYLRAIDEDHIPEEHKEEILDKISSFAREMDEYFNISENLHNAKQEHLSEA